MDSQRAIAYLETETTLVKMVTGLTKRVSAQHSDANLYLDMGKLNNILKSNIAMCFQVKKEQIPDFRVHREMKAVIMDLGDLSTLIFNIVETFNGDFGPKDKWRWG